MYCHLICIVTRSHCHSFGSACDVSPLTAFTLLLLSRSLIGLLCALCFALLSSLGFHLVSWFGIFHKIWKVLAIVSSDFFSSYFSGTVVYMLYHDTVPQAAEDLLTVFSPFFLDASLWIPFCCYVFIFSSPVKPI